MSEAPAQSACLALFVSLVLLAHEPGVAGSFTDPRANLQPLVLTGDEVTDLLGRRTNEIWAYRYDGGTGAFVQVPVQVDERALYDLTGGQSTPVYELTYDWSGLDDGLLDADDEIALMARDAGERAPDTDVWVTGADDTRVELQIEDPLTAEIGWLYLFTSPTLVDTDPSFAYVSYTAPDPTSGVGQTETPSYVVGYEGRWRLTRIEVKPNADLLDRYKVRAYAIVGAQTEETYEGTSELLGAYSGKIRALREVQGAASGPLTTILDSFYRDTWVRNANMRVHAITDVWAYYDFLPPAAAGRFYSSSVPSGLPLDGVNDVPPSAAVPGWSQVSLPTGTLVIYARELTPFPPPDPRTSCAADAGAEFYWRDDDMFDDLSGDDAAAFGNHGTHLHCPGDTNTSPYSTSATHYFLPPQNPYSPVAPDYAERETNPLQFTAQAQVRQALADARLDSMAREGDGRLTFFWTDTLNEDGYEVYRGQLTSLFQYNHDTSMACGLPAQTTSWTTPQDEVTAQPSYYYLVVPRRGSQRQYGTDSSGSPRPPSAAACP